MEENNNFTGGFEANKIANDTVASPIDNIVTQIRDKVQPNSSSNELQKALGNIERLKGINSPYAHSTTIDPTTKPSFYEKNYNIDELYAKLPGSGEYVKKFDTYTPGIDNNEYFAQNQSTGEKWANGIMKAGLKTKNAVVGGTVGLVYGLGAAVSDRSLTSVYDNKFSNWLNDLDTKLNYQLPNYYTKQEQNAGVFGQAATANFWADKFLGGLSFTAGAIISEGIWAWATGGTSLATTGARLASKAAKLGNYGKWGVNALGEVGAISAVAKTKGLYAGLSVGEDALKLGAQSRKMGVNFGKAGEIASIAGRTLRSAGYEASVEALQYKKEAEENFYNNFANLNGREPDEQEIADFENENTSTANAVFGVNMAIVGTSNLAMLGNVLNIKNPINLGIGDFINKKAFGYGVDIATNTVLKGSRKQIVTRNVFDYIVKPGVTEGLFEEGLQGVTNKTANKWIEHTYNPKYSNSTFDSVESFTSSLDEQYLSEAGWKDNMLGILIGIAGGSVNVKSEQKQTQSEYEMQASIAKTYNTETLQSLILPHRIQTSNRMQGFADQAREEELKGNVTNTQVAKIGEMTSYINSELVMGESVKSITGKMSKALDAMTEEQWNESGVESENIEIEKKERLGEFTNLAQQWQTNKEYVKYMVGNKVVGTSELEDTALERLFGSFSKPAQIVEALTWQLTVGENSSKIMADTEAIFGREVGTEYKSVLNTLSKLKRRSKTRNREFVNLQKEYDSAVIQRDKLEKKLTSIQNRTSTSTDSQKAEYESVSKAYVKANEKVENARKRADAIAEELSKTENYKTSLEGVDTTAGLSGETVTGQQLLEINKNIQKFKSTLEFLKETDPKKYNYLNGLLEEYSSAEDMFMQAQATQKALVSPEFKIENIDGWLDNLFKKNKSMSEDTKTWFQDSINNYSKSKTKLLSESLQVAEEIVTEEEYTDFIDNGVVSEEVLNSIADKYIINQGKDFTKQEAAIFASKVAEINAIIKLKNIQTKPKSQEQINKEQIDKLNEEREVELEKVKLKPTGIKDNTEIDRIEEQREKELELKKDSLDDVFSIKDTRTVREVINEKYDTLIKLETVKQNYGQEATDKLEAEKAKINAKYDKKISALKEVTLIESYKQRIKNLINNVYQSLDYLPKDVNSLADRKPTKEEIEEYSELVADKKQSTKRAKELRSKLNDWKLLATAIDEDYTTIADLIDLIQQLETEVEQEETKDEVTDEEAIDDLFTQPSNEGEGLGDNKNMVNNTNQPVTAKFTKGVVQLTHVKARYIVDQIGTPYFITRGNKIIENSNIDSLQPGDVVMVDNMSFTIDENYRLEFKESEFDINRQKQVNLYIERTQDNLNFTAVYSIYGQDRVRATSQFADDNINTEKTFFVKQGDVLTLHVEDSDGWNESKKGSSQDEFKIYLKDAQGNIVGTLKSGKAKYGSAINEDFLNLRTQAFTNWDLQGRPKSMDLGISITADDIFLGSAELLFEEGVLVEGDISKEASERVIIAKGYIQDGEVFLDTEIKDVDKTYVRKISKDNPGLKQPIIVFKKGAYNIAFPITMKKSVTPVDFDVLLQGNPQEMVLSINESIAKNKIKVDKLTFEDITLDSNNEAVLSDKAEKVKEAFANRETFVTAEEVLNKNYKRESLAKDASIRIDLDNIDAAITAPKIRVNLKEATYKTTRDFMYESMIVVENTLSELAIELAKDYTGKADTKYLDNKGNIIEDTKYTDTFDDNEMRSEDNALSRVHNLNILKEAFSEKIPKKLADIIGADKIAEVKKLIERYDFIKSQQVTKPGEVKDGLEKIDEDC